MVEEFVSVVDNFAAVAEDEPAVATSPPKQFFYIQKFHIPALFYHISTRFGIRKYFTATISFSTIGGGCSVCAGIPSAVHTNFHKHKKQ